MLYVLISTFLQSVITWWAHKVGATLCPLPVDPELMVIDGIITFVRVIFLLNVKCKEWP
jgi:hypothetical protein